MKMRRIAVLWTFCALSLIGVAQAKEALDLEKIVSGSYNAEYMRHVVPMADGLHYTQMNVDRTKIIQYSFATGREVKTLFDVATARECKFKSFDGYQLSPDETKLLIQTETAPIYRRSFTAHYYIYTVKNNRIDRLSDGGAQQVPVFSPDGNLIAFVRDYNIYLVKLLYGNSESQVTKDGEVGKILNGVPDWVYEEEFGLKRALEFSPDNTMLAYIRFDESEVPTYSFPLYEGQAPSLTQFSLYPGQYSYKYPVAGKPNSKVSVHSFDIKSKVTRRMSLPTDIAYYIPRIRFTQSEEALAIMTFNRHQNRFDMYFANPRSAVCKLIVRDESPYYINPDNMDNIVFYPENFSFISEKDGFRQLYWYSMGGNQLKQVTKGDYEVKRFIGWQPTTNTFFYESNEESPLKCAVYKIDAKGKKSKLSTRTGTNNALFSTSLDYFINTYSNLTTPPRVTLNTSAGKELGILMINESLTKKLSKLELPQKEFFIFTTSEGVKLNGWMFKPANFSEAKKYPVVMYQYSGPGSQEVLDRWGVASDRQGLGWEGYMASRGYIVACVDGRGTGGRGEAFEKCTYMNLGVKESFDQVEAAKYLGTKPYVDQSRIAIWGWSYGGYTTLMSMSEGSHVFKAGVAVAAVTDWKYYDTIYGERFMRTPKENADGYKNASAFTRSEKLFGELLLVHGTADDNVHYENCAEYAEQLVQINKPFDMQIYTNRNHSIRGGNTRYHLYSRLTRFMDSNLMK